MPRPYDIERAFQRIEDELISSMIRNLKRYHLDWEVAEDKQWEQWQVLQLKALEKYKKDNRAKFGSQFSNINSQIDALLRMANGNGQLSQERSILKAIRAGFPAKPVSQEMAATFFRLNDRKLEALIKATTNDMKRAEIAVLRRAEDQYRQVIFNAQVYANTGAGTYEKAVDMATKDFLASGINCIEYKNGARHTIADYAEMAIRTASKRAYLQGEGVKRQEWGISTVIVNKRGTMSNGNYGSACPYCIPWLGKVLIDDVWSGGSASGKSPQTGQKYPLMSEAVAGGLYHPRCKDSHTTYFEGISTPPKPVTEEDKQSAEENEKKEQKEQYAKRQAKKYERMAEHSLDPENQKKYEARAEQWGVIAEGYDSGPITAGLNAPVVTNSDEVIDEFMNAIELPNDQGVIDRVRKSVKHMRKEDLDMIREHGLIVRKTKGSSCFVRSRRSRGTDGKMKHVIRINPDRNEPFVFAHECAHMAEKINDLYHDPEFEQVLQNFAKSVERIVEGKVGRKWYCTAVSDLLIESYQGRTYVEHLGRSYERALMIEDFVEYISVGYECFVGDPKLLEKKDPVLYNYFVRRGLR